MTFKTPAFFLLIPLVLPLLVHIYFHRRGPAFQFPSGTRARK